MQLLGRPWMMDSSSDDSLHQTIAWKPFQLWPMDCELHLLLGARHVLALCDCELAGEIPNLYTLSFSLLVEAEHYLSW